MYCGVDIIEIERIARLSLRARFLERVYSHAETELAQTFSHSRKAEFLAGRFAAKEAVIKALKAATEEGDHDRSILRARLQFRDIEILRSANGAPLVKLYGASLEIVEELQLRWHQVSISHDRHSAVAMVILAH